jgi:diguanylate cyclase (GGDEF)-like protein
LDCQIKLSLGYYQSALEVASSSISQHANLKENHRYGELLICYGLSLELTGDIERARLQFNHAIVHAESTTDMALASYAYRSRGDLNAYHGTIESALNDLQEAFRIASKENDKNSMSQAENSLGNLYLYIKDYSKALDSYLRVYQFSKESNNKVEMAVASFNLGKVYYLMDELAKSKKHYQESSRISLQIGDIAGVAYAERGLGKIEYELENIEESVSRLSNAKNLFDKLGDPMQVAETDMLLGTQYLKANQFQLSIEAYESAATVFEQKQSLYSLTKCYIGIAESYAAIGEYKKAYLAQRKYSHYFQKHYNQQQDNSIANLRVKFDTEIKEKENILLSEKNKLANMELDKQKQISNFKNIVLTLAASIFILLVYHIIRHIKTKKQLEILARTDPLTELANRRHIMEFAEREFSLAKRGKHYMCLLIFDIDHFKSFNDKYGHKIGDQVLIEVASRCQSLLRESDLLGRIGGEEFLILLPQTEMSTGALIAERCRQGVESIDTMDIAQGSQLTISIGVAEYNDSYESVIDMLNESDKALYRAKKNGRNQVQCAILNGTDQVGQINLFLSL